MTISAQKKIILLVLLVILIFGSITAVSIFFYTKQKLINLEEENNKIFTKSISDEIKLFFDQSSMEVQILAKDKDIISYLENKSKKNQDPKILAILQDKLLNSFYLTASIFDTKGISVVSTDEQILNKDFSFRDYFKKNMEGNPYIDSGVGIITNEASLFFTFPVKNKLGEIIGSVLLRTSSSKIYNIFNEKLIGENIMMFTDEFGIVLVSNKEERIFKSLGKLTTEEEAKIRESKKYNDKVIESLQYNLVKKQFNSLSKNIGMVTFFDIPDDEKEVITFLKVPEYNYYMVLEQNYENIFNIAFQTAFIISFFVLLTAIFSFIVISFFIYRFFRLNEEKLL